MKPNYYLIYFQTLCSQAKVNIPNAQRKNKQYITHLQIEVQYMLNINDDSLLLPSLAFSCQLDQFLL